METNTLTNKVPNLNLDKEKYSFINDNYTIEDYINEMEQYIKNYYINRKKKYGMDITFEIFKKRTLLKGFTELFRVYIKNNKDFKYKPYIKYEGDEINIYSIYNEKGWRRCKICHIHKPDNEYNKGDTACSKCRRNIAKNYNRTIPGVVSAIYNKQITNSEKRGHKPPTYTKESLMKHLLSNKQFMNLYYQWVNSGYKTDLKPSLDRINNNLGYTLSNIRIVTWKENSDNAIEDIKQAKLITTHKSICQYDRDGNFIKEYPSIAIASRAVGAKSTTHISRCAKGLARLVKGYQWRYPDDCGECKEKIDSIGIKYNSKKVKQYTLEGEFVKEYESISKAGRMTGIDNESIRLTVNGKRKTAGGLIWK